MPRQSGNGVHEKSATEGYLMLQLAGGRIWGFGKEQMRNVAGRRAGVFTLFLACGLERSVLRRSEVRAWHIT